MGRRDGNDAKQATAPRECSQWRGTSEFRVRCASRELVENLYTNRPFVGSPQLKLSLRVTTWALGSARYWD